MSKPKNLKDPVNVTVTLPKKFCDHLRRSLLRQSSKVGRNIPLSEMIRELLFHVYPMPDDPDLFQMKIKEPKNRTIPFPWLT